MSRKTILRMKNFPSLDPHLGPIDKSPWHIFARSGEYTDHLRIGSVRKGRALRAAREIARYTQATVFISHAEMANGDGSPTSWKPVGLRFYTTEKYVPPKHTPRVARSEPLNDRGESLSDVMVDIYRERLARRMDQS